MTVDGTPVGIRYQNYLLMRGNGTCPAGTVRSFG